MKATWAYSINTLKNVNLSGEVFLYVLTHFFVLVPIKIQSLHNKMLFNVWVTENRIRAILPLYSVYIFYILDLSGMCCNPYVASLGRLPSRGSSIVVGGPGQPQRPPEWALGVWILQLSSCSHGWNITLVSWTQLDSMWLAVLMQTVKMFPSCIGANKRNGFNYSSCIEMKPGTVP